MEKNQIAEPAMEQSLLEPVPSTPVDRSSEVTSNKENDSQDNPSPTDLDASKQGEDIVPTNFSDSLDNGQTKEANINKGTEGNQDYELEASKVPAKEATKLPSKEASKAPAKEATKLPSKDATKAPAKEDTKLPNKEATKTPVKEPLITSKPEDTINESQPSMESLAKDVITNIIMKEMSDVEKVRVVHDYIVLNTEYDYDNLLANTIPLESFQVEGVLVHGKAVCQGYAETFQLFMELLGIESKIVTGIDLKTNVGHAWNQVKLEGEWYHIDSTWDDPVPDQKDKVQYKYFLVTDEVLSVDHRWDRTKYPESQATKYQYYVYQDFIIDSIKDYEAKFIELYQQGNNEITILYPERGMPDMDFLGKYDYFYREVDGRSVVTYGWYPTWELGDYTVLTVLMK